MADEQTVAPKIVTPEKSKAPKKAKAEKAPAKRKYKKRRVTKDAEKASENIIPVQIGLSKKQLKAKVKKQRKALAKMERTMEKLTGQIADLKKKASHARLNISILKSVAQWKR